MIARLCYLVFFILLVFSLSAYAPAQNNILPYPIYQYKLDNDLNVVTVPFDSPGLVAFYLVVRTGARNEIEKGVTGFAHFFEHMMFRGTDKYPKGKYNAILKSTGAAANANTSKDRTLFHITGNAEKLEIMFDIEADRFKNLNYSLHDFKTEAGAVKGEYTKNYADPYERIYERIMDTAFDVHPYKHTTMGFFDDIVDMPNQYEYSQKFFKRFYRPEYCTIVVVGDVKPGNVNKLSEKYFGDWECGNYLAEIPVEPLQKKTRYTHLQNDEIPPFLSLNYKGPAFSDKIIDMPALDVLSSIVFSKTSELYKRLVLQERKVRYLYGGAYDSRDPFLFTIEISLVDKSDLQYVKDEIVKVIEDVKKNGVAEDILHKTKSHLKYNFAMSIDNPDEIANSLSHYIMLTGNAQSLNNLYKLYDKVTVEDIKMVATKYFVVNSLTVATITSDDQGGVK
jgi:zinc protease